MEDFNKRIREWLKAWKKADSFIRKKAKETYRDIEDILAENPELAQETSTILFNVYRLALEQKYIQALGFLSLLSVSLYYKYKRSKKKD
jgi:hypothetical protein